VASGSITPPAQPSAAVLVPVKAFQRAKQRLAPARQPQERIELAQAMAATVLAAAGRLPTAVVCDDDEVRAWAEAQGAEAIWTPGLGLNGAVEAGVAHLARRGVDQVVVAHADLPLATDLSWLPQHGVVTLVPDRRRDGTNVACIPAAVGFTFAYGAGSFAAHRVEAARLHLITRLVPDPRLGWDVDEPADLEVPAVMQPPGYLIPVPAVPSA
jgi:2-phospho-L-lactate/phosphoenolpyruvate guanylyltransferase